jgi:tetratricopeptide (TPR) repeat protein
VRLLAILLTLGCSTAAAQSPDRWTLAQNSHFEIYSQTADKTAQNALLWFEQLRSFFQQSGLFAGGFHDQGRPTLRVIGFRSERDYAEYRIRPLADAYYTSNGKREYIVLASMKPKEFGVAAHEYAHYVLHANGLKLPSCIQEGLAEFFSTLRVKNQGYELGGDLPARSQTLERDRNGLLPLTELLAVNGESGVFRSRKGAEVFYAESWALVDMLMGSAAYSGRFAEFVAQSNAGASGDQLFRKVYGKSLEEVAADLEIWVRDEHLPREIVSPASDLQEMQISPLSAIQSRSLLAQLLVLAGHLDEASVRYQDLARLEPANPDFLAALGDIAEKQDRLGDALHLWRQALDHETKDADLCYRYALLAEDSGVSSTEVTSALERAVLLDPGFDDARYKLALLQYRAGEYQSAVVQLRAMRLPVASRRFAYWIALAAALLELKQHEQAKAAAEEAFRVAQTDDQKMSARRTVLMADTDFTVQFATDAEGHSHIITTRVPHGTADWNPFIEPSDQIQHASGELTEVLCSKGKLTGFVITTASDTVKVEVPDPFHVLMRNAPSEFFCGPMQARAVEADYAVTREAGRNRNILRGMTYKQ